MADVYWTCAFVLACILIYRFGVPMFRRFDEENVRRIAQQARDTSDPDAHIRHTLEMADEQVEEVQEIRTGGTTQYLFEAEIFASRDEAEEKRAERVGVIARRFYQELPAALAGRGERGHMSARERASKRWKKTVH